jgi:tetratricopeptide (TPR) repeat protein
MTNYSCLLKRSRTLIILIMAAVSLNAQSNTDFAMSLMKDRDYFRAISLYKELAFFSHDRDSIIFYYSQIGKAYRLSQKYQLSVSTYSRLLNDYKLIDSMSRSIYLNLGLNYLEMNVPGQAISYFQEAQKTDTVGYSLFYLGLTAVEMSDWIKAQYYYDQLALKTSAANLQALSKEFSSTIAGADRIPQRSPCLSALMSTFVPGSGQVYTGHYIDALQAFAFVSAFSFASYIAYQHDKNNNSNYLLTGISISITGLFHFANIIGAERTASYYNQRQKDLFIQEIRQKSYSLENYK